MNSPQTTTTEKTPDVDSFCSGKSNDLYPYTSCNQYLQCANGKGHIKTCPEGLNFNTLGYCDWPDNVVCVTNMAKELNRHDKKYINFPTRLASFSCLMYEPLNYINSSTKV